MKASKYSTTQARVRKAIVLEFSFLQQLLHADHTYQPEREPYSKKKIPPILFRFVRISSSFRAFHVYHARAPTPKPQKEHLR